MDVAELIKCLGVGDLQGAMVHAPRVFHETLELQRLMPNGWKYHGTGFYSSVIGPEDSDKVFKLSWKGSDPWIQYAEHVTQQPMGSNPLMPKIYNLFVDDGRAIAVMERLYESEIVHSVGMSNVVKLCKNQWFGIQFRTLNSKRKKIADFLRYQFDMRGNRNYNTNNLADIVIWMAGLPDAKVDCHGSNWMIRTTGQLVLTDPIG